ncbi:MAG: FAD-dependent oxidoreductase [Syntrophaceae bacterium]
MTYPHLFSEGCIGKVTIRNRIVMPPMEVGMSNFDGTPSEQLMAYYEERARNGLGLLITGIARVNELHGAAHPRQLAMSHDRHIEPYGRMVERVHAYGTKVFCQLHHPGRQNFGAMVGTWLMSGMIGRFWPGYWNLFIKLGSILSPYAQKLGQWGLTLPVVGPSAVVCTYDNQRTRALWHVEVKRLVRDFIRAAKRVQLSGADGVELHAAHGYLIQQFLSPHTNRRTDEYGGSLDNRLRFLLEIIRGIRAECGPDFPIMVRLSVDEYYRCIGKPGSGIELEEGVEMARRLEQAGIDAIDVSSATYETMNYWLEPISYEPGWRTNLAQAVKGAVSIPVLAANLIRSASQAEAQLSEGIQDFVCLGRPFLADPAWAAKVSQGAENDIKRCISCLWCFESLVANALKCEPLECAVNPRLGREQETAVPLKDGAGRTVVVIGAGPAGLAAAEILGLRGFKPIVLEKNAEVGGQLQLANKPPKKEKINWCFTDLLHAAQKNGAEIRFKTTATREVVQALNPYAVIVATGGEAIRPPIEGVQLPHVATCTEVLSGSVKVSGKRVAVIGAGLTGLETAEKLAEDGNQILMVEMLGKVGQDALPQSVDDVMSRLKGYNPTIITGHKLVEIKPGSIMLEHVKTKQRNEQRADHVVLAVGVKSNDALAHELMHYFPKMAVIGDAYEVGRIAHAIRDGFDTAWDLE